MDETFEYYRILVLRSAHPPGVLLLGKVVLGVPIERIRELIEEFPDHPFRGRDLRVDQDTSSEISEDAEVWIRGRLGIPESTDITFRLDTSDARPLPPARPADFSSPDGQKFWIESL
jgi:hypothetical protein